MNFGGNIPENINMSEWEWSHRDLNSDLTDQFLIATLFSTLIWVELYTRKEKVEIRNRILTSSYVWVRPAVWSCCPGGGTLRRASDGGLALLKVPVVVTGGSHFQGDHVSVAVCVCVCVCTRTCVWSLEWFGGEHRAVGLGFLKT